MAQQKLICLASMRTWVRSLASISGLRIPHCHELWCRSQTRLGSRVAVAVVQDGSYSSDLTPSLGTSICHGNGPRKGRKTKNKQTNKNTISEQNLSTLTQTSGYPRAISSSSTYGTSHAPSVKGKDIGPGIDPQPLRPTPRGMTPPRLNNLA